MSKSFILKIIFAAALFILPLTTNAAELKFGDKLWPIDISTTNQVEAVHVRNDASAKSLATSILTGKIIVDKTELLNPATAAQLEKVAAEVNRPPKSAKLVIENDWAKEFEPDQLGQAMDIIELRNNILAGGETFELPVSISYPETRLGDLNNLGINELVAVGESDFTGSSRNRVTNITVGSSKHNGLILKPGEEFSFNKYLGDVDAAHGFKPEIVIKREGLVPEYGGGLCQVSSTAFRGAMNAGFKVTERKNHAFAVRYYSPAGTDATIYSPQLDLKFINDLSSHMLVRTRMEGTKLFYEYYGTKDDRKVVLEGPVHYDRKSDGSLKAVWTKKVTKNGVEDVQEFRSTYVSPSLYQKVATTPTPTPTPVPTEPVPTPTPTDPAPTPAPTL